MDKRDLLTIRAMGLGSEGQMTHAQWEQHCADTPGLAEAWAVDPRNPAAVAGWIAIADRDPPKDGTLIELSWFDQGRPQERFLMRWGHIHQNGLFPGQVGMWVAPDGSLTWNDRDPAGAPTHWRLPTPTLRAKGGE